MIVKCQLSQFTTAADRQMLFYNRAEDWIWQGTVTPEWLDLFESQGARFFAKVRWRNGEPPEFVGALTDLGW
jgi:hypothetical protein